MPYIKWAIAILVALSPIATFADEHAIAPTHEEIEALLKASGAADIGTQIGPTVAHQVILTLHNADKDLPDRADSAITDVVVSFLRQRAEQDHLADQLIPIYSKYLSADDVRELTAFYRSPIGRKLVTLTPTITQESARLGQQWALSILPELQTRLLNRLKEENLIK